MDWIWRMENFDNFKEKRIQKSKKFLLKDIFLNDLIVFDFFLR